MKKHIPNLLTLLNLVSGVIAIYMVMQGDVQTALIFLGISFILDFADGTAARLLKAGSEIGKQLDSLADLVSFGLVSTVMVWAIFQKMFSEDQVFAFTSLSFPEKILALSVLMIPVLSAIRLARFNLQKDSTWFAGLPVPAYALFWAGIYFDMLMNNSFFGQEVNPWFLWGVLIMMSLMMIVPLPMLSLKFTNFRLKENLLRYILIIAAILIVIFTGLAGLPLVILTYILLSLLRIVLT